MTLCVRKFKEKYLDICSILTHLIFFSRAPDAEKDDICFVDGIWSLHFRNAKEPILFIDRVRSHRHICPYVTAVYTFALGFIFGRSIDIMQRQLFQYKNYYWCCARVCVYCLKSLCVRTDTWIRYYFSMLYHLWKIKYFTVSFYIIRGCPS